MDFEDFFLIAATVLVVLGFGFVILSISLISLISIKIACCCLLAGLIALIAYGICYQFGK